MAATQKPLTLGVRAMAPEAGKGVKKDDGASSTPQTKSVSWRDKAAACGEQDPRLRKMWSEPDWANFKVRSKNYLEDKVKLAPQESLLELVWFDQFSGEHQDVMHTCRSKKSFAQKALAKYGTNMPQLFVVTLIIPGSPVIALVQYFVEKPEAVTGSSKEAHDLWKQFVFKDDEFRRSRLKLITSIPEGPWIIKKSVGSKPVILGNAIQIKFFQTPTYLEACVDICSDRVAKHVTSLCRSQSSSFKVDMGYVIEGKTESELPERLLGCVQYDHLELAYAVPIRDPDQGKN